jgi:hypothetical protein
MFPDAGKPVNGYQLSVICKTEDKPIKIMRATPGEHGAVEIGAARQIEGRYRLRRLPVPEFAQVP